MDDFGYSQLAEEALSTFDEIASTANSKFNALTHASTDSFAAGNTLTGAAAYQKLRGIQQVEREALQKLCEEPAILRVVLQDDADNHRVIYIARTSNLPLSSGKEFASYRSPIGRIAEIPPGDEVSITLKGQEHLYWVIEKTSFKPTIDSSIWDSRPSQYRHYDRGAYSIESLRALLQAEDSGDSDELDRLLEQAEAQVGIVKGISHQLRTAMGLRDQPILDQFQGEIFRLPLNTQLIILGPPGTGKTTTLIKRLGQKLDLESLDTEERRLSETSNTQRPHQNSWLMFTPSELLKHYLKEAFSREHVPASDTQIRTWISFRNDIARNTLGILRTANGGKFTLKVGQSLVLPAVVEEASAWFDKFRVFHELRLRKQFKDGVVIVSTAALASDQKVVQKIKQVFDIKKERPLIEIYRTLDSLEDSFKKALADSKAIADDLLKRERNRLYNADKEVFQRLAKHLEAGQQDYEQDEEELFDDDETDERASPSLSAIQGAVQAYLSSLKALARSKYLKRSIPKKSRSGSVIRFLGESIPNDEVLKEIGRHISFQNGLRRFIQSHKRYVMDVIASYQQFRKDRSVLAEFYSHEDISTSQISGIELDAIILLMLKNARQLMRQSFVLKSLDEPRYNYLSNIGEIFRNQIMVDEATDFSMVELACMESLTSLASESFFVCGDFNQRITTTGIRRREQLEWVSSLLSVRTVQIVYRQSRKLNAFTGELLRLQGGDLSSLGQVFEDSNHEGVDPVLREWASDVDASHWIAERIMEVERSVKQLPTIAVLVNSEKEVKPTAECLTHYLEGVNLRAVACEEGKALGEGADVRVFDIQHIKGLEFEAVFFAGIDTLAKDNPELFDRYLYVGATRAATYLGLVCGEGLPHELSSLRPMLKADWS
ncbi:MULTISPECIES: ATP-binding domain-containing protein [unclassified Halomonas]|uniref:ATP-binding domain-containing protein n=1 Tax=unclassified Halomonas TaxID=2609666 RepID=UPI0007D94FFA|nr:MULTISPECIES: ATP-binding domain-containing protein [unclassified Halomonas]MBT2788018.1 ATP-binding domain-containing protein [Halomonas sp. ISL-106]MBT2795767.1 ATP-binding domain-containing protein [Halomonas sp. ISL-104]OAL61061.1 hypothetical protein A6R74_15770 [Halomonas sp. ALS9]